MATGPPAPRPTFPEVPFYDEEMKSNDNNYKSAEGAGIVAVDVHNSSSALNSTPYLQSRLIQLRHQSQDLSTELTKKLATSRSGQSLLHIGPSLSSLPPDLTSLLEALSPLIAQVEQYESENRIELERLVSMGREVQCAMKRREFSLECAEIYSDLMGAEEVLRWSMTSPSSSLSNKNINKKNKTRQQQSNNNKGKSGGANRIFDENKHGDGCEYMHDDDDWSEDEKDEGQFHM